MSRILAIDFGAKRTGIAVTDPLQIVASGLCTVPTEELNDFIAGYLAQEKVETIVIGEPRQMDYSLSELGERIHAFAKALQLQYPDKKVSLIDERFTSKMAQRTLIDSGVKKMKRRNKALIDEIAATIILQSYLDRK
jgi:putative Holliday junction resolvase